MGRRFGVGRLVGGLGYVGHTLFVPLYSAHIELSTSTRSPNVYGNGGPLEMADATADLRKSMVTSLLNHIFYESCVNLNMYTPRL